MAIPSSLYNTDTTETYGTTEIELTKKIEDLYPTTGNVDNSIAYTKYNASWLYTAGVTCYPYEDGGSSIKFADYEPDTSYCYKYYNWESDVPLTDANVNVCIIAPGSSAGYYYINSESIIDYGINDSRFVRNAQTNKMLFTAQARRINLTELEPYKIERGSASHVFPLQTVDLKYIDSHPDEYFYDFSLTGCFVWNGSEWIAASYVPAYISTSSSSQGIATINTCFNRRGIYYDMDTRQDSELYIHEDGSSDGFEANGAIGWSLGWPQNVEVAPYYTSIGDMANLNALIAAEIEGEETRIDIITCQRAIPVNDIWYYFTWCSGVYYNHPDGMRNASHSSYYCPCIKGSTLSKLIAGCGLYFLADPNADLTSITPNTLGNCADIWLGEMSGDFTTTGNWIKGANINSYTGANREGNVFNGGFDPDYTPQPPTPEGDDTSDDQESGGIYGGAQGMCNLYYMTTSEIKNLQDWFRGTVFAPGIQIPADFDPSNQLIGLMAFPIELGGSVDGTTITFRTADNQSVDTGVSCQKAYGDDLKFDMGTINIPARMQERGVPFLDYSSQIEVYIPFCDVVQLDVQQVIGTTLKCEMWISPATGDVSAMLSSGTHPVAYTSGNCAQQLPISVSSYGAIAGAKLAAENRMTQAVFQAAQNVVKDVTNAGAITSAVSNHTAVNGQGLVEFSRIPQVQSNTGLAVGAGIKAGGDIVNTALNLTATNLNNKYAIQVAKNSAPTHVSGSFGSCTSWHFPNYCYAKITRPHFQKPTNYGHTEAVPVVATKPLSSLTGLTTCVNPDVSSIGTATMQELETIKSYLMTGVIL